MLPSERQLSGSRDKLLDDRYVGGPCHWHRAMLINSNGRALGYKIINSRLKAPVETQANHIDARILASVEEARVTNVHPT